MKSFNLPRGERNRVLDGVSAQLSRHDEILFAYAYGSFLEDGPFRDLDIAVCLSSQGVPVSSFHYEDTLARALTQALNLSFPLDLRILNEAPVPFKYRAFQGRLLFEKDLDSRLEMVTHVVARYLDLKPFLRHYVKEAFGGET